MTFFPEWVTPIVIINKTSAGVTFEQELVQDTIEFRRACCRCVFICHLEDITTTEDFIRYPKLIVEVLSKSTANFDSTEKFADYQTCSTLEEYVLVSQTQQQIVHYTLKDGLWLRHEVTDIVGVERSGFLYLPSVDGELTLPDIYRKVPGFEQKC